MITTMSDLDNHIIRRGMKFMWSYVGKNPNTNPLCGRLCLPLYLLLGTLVLHSLITASKLNF